MRTIINIKTEKQVKQNAQRIAKDLGLSLSAVINAYLKQFVRDKAVNFSIAPQMSAELEDELKSVEFDIQRNRNISKVISTKAELDEHLDSL
ncbi:type II toxin-antitoxin system RelB/DinJ family antitoxin [Candidatus Kuenenbacteria bacterium]|nr:type II toxin-antitoxin system RelB/DinJ family antitoxin [Candidatus Kuenenbacteria bacterium]